MLLDNVDLIILGNHLRKTRKFRKGKLRVNVYVVHFELNFNFKQLVWV